ncbi:MULTISPECIES: alternative oxidase [Aliivibrio]|uniref:Oxidase n=2 Tax=Aliivibrio fischeri TaxID=668 RepID=A0A6N3YXT6_ALIFS|nr:MULTISPECIES: alternative oxidase [Aliivibrio]ACH65862.1 alternative oxidase 2 [Aliivibrio fischeri MJ11]MBD1571137.1 oxidase [Aliivibrio sp. S10_S31]MCE4937319.1 alternative oxidase [Aliivibrio fischeri]MCE7537852.1 alternative oxidase [Aliivibrio fischeri]MCE7560740.1 alternative oxidase [Aliivibrio fischeri]
MSDFELKHKATNKISEKIAYKITQCLKFLLNIFYGSKYAKRAVILETIAAVPGMVAGMFNHLKALRRMKDDQGWIQELLSEAENERMHLMIFLDIAKPRWIERLLVLLGQAVFIVVYSFIYLLSSKIAHRVVGYFEEEACKSYTEYLAKIDEGAVENEAAPQIAIDYYQLPSDAMLRDVILKIRNDEAKHRDRNHSFADAYETHDLPAHQR